MAKSNAQEAASVPATAPADSTNAQEQAAPPPAVTSDKERIAQLEAQLQALKDLEAQNVLPPPGGDRPTQGPLHKDGHQIFNGNRPTGRHG